MIRHIHVYQRFYVIPSNVVKKYFFSFLGTTKIIESSMQCKVSYEKIYIAQVVRALFYWKRTQRQSSDIESTGNGFIT